MRTRMMTMILLVFSWGGVAHSGLLDPAVTNPSFESVENGGTPGNWGYIIDDWYENEVPNSLSNFYEIGSTIGLTCDGILWAGTETGGEYYQVIGTWDAGKIYEITFLIGSRSGFPFGTGAVRLYAGGSEGNAADGVDLSAISGVTLLSEAQITIADGTQVSTDVYEVTVQLTTGSGQNPGDTLWLEFGSVSGKDYFDNFQIVEVDSNSAVVPMPQDGAVNVDVQTYLQWDDPSAYTPTGFDVYFGTNSIVYNNPKVVSNQNIHSYDPPGDLAEDTTYYWVVDTYENGSILHPGYVWSFTTAGPFVPAPPLKKGPYLIYTGVNTEMRVLWQLTSSQTCEIGWGLDSSCSDGSAQVSSYGSDYQFAYTITNLTPGTKYYYYVYADGGYQLGDFLTAPTASATSVKFIAYGDSRDNPSGFDSVNAEMINTYTTDPGFQTLALHVGDWIGADTETEWTTDIFPTSTTNTRQLMSQLPIQGARGNHEGSCAVYTKYWPYPYENSCYWSFDYGPIHVAIVDQYVDYSSGSAQLNWLTSDLANSTKEWKFIVLHQPGWSAGGGHSNDVNVQAVIQPLCLAYGVDIVFGGHNHYYSRCLVDGVHHITTGGAGAPLYAPNMNSDYLVSAEMVLHFCEVDIQDNVLNYTARRENGTVIDTFNVTHMPDDAEAPIPDPMTWETLPYATGDASISMTATTASDPSGVEYYFTCTAGGGHDSGWQDSTSYEDTGLSPETSYTYTVKARDKSTNQNTTGESSSESATTDVLGPDIAISDHTHVAGTISGNYVDTQVQDDVYETITEIYSGLKSQLEHIWGFDVTSGNGVFKLDAYYADSGDMDTGFIFSWATDPSGPWTDMFTVTKTADDDTYQTYDLGSPSGNIYIRVVDNDRTKKESGLDTIFIDHMEIDVAGTSDTTPPVPNPMTWATLPYATSDSSISMTAMTASDPSGVQYYFTCTAGGGHDSGWQSSSTYEDAGLTPDTTYTYTVKARDLSSNQNETAASSAESATTDAGCVPVDCHVDSIVCGLASCAPPNSNGQVTVTIVDNCGNPVSGAVVQGTFTGDFSETANGTTNASGVAILTTTGCVKKPSYVFCVDDVTASLTYDDTDNVETCDSY